MLSFCSGGHERERVGRAGCQSVMVISSQQIETTHNQINTQQYCTTTTPSSLSSTNTRQQNKFPFTILWDKAKWMFDVGQHNNALPSPATSTAMPFSSSSMPRLYSSMALSLRPVGNKYSMVWLWVVLWATVAQLTSKCHRHFNDVKPILCGKYTVSLRSEFADKSNQLITQSSLIDSAQEWY